MKEANGNGGNYQITQDRREEGSIQAVESSKICHRHIQELVSSGSGFLGKNSTDANKSHRPGKVPLALVPSCH